MDGDGILLVVMVFCVVMSAYFSATETAFSSLNRIRIKGMAEKGNRRAALVLRLESRYDSLLSTILIGNNIVNIAAASVATVFCVRLFGNESGPSISTAATTIVILIFGEVSPKSIAKESPEQFALFSAPLLRLLMAAFVPLTFLFSQWKKVLSKIFKAQGDRSITEEELLSIVDEAEHDGGIGAQESTLIRSAIEFSDLDVLDVLTPRIDVAAVPVDASKQEVADVFLRTGFSRLPVYEGSIDNITGIIYQKDFHNRVFHSDSDIRSIVRNVLFVTEGKHIGELLKELQRKKMHLAVVLDEFGGTVGIVTMEDILEQLVGDIWDEHDNVVEEITENGGVFTVRGSAGVQKLFERLGIDRAFDVVTVSGWCVRCLGRIPETGDRFESDGLSVTVLEMDGKRVAKIRLEKSAADPAVEEGGRA